MNIPHDNLHALDEGERLYNITYEHQKQRTSDLTVREIYKILNEIKAHYAAEGLLREAFHTCEKRTRTSSDALEYCRPDLTYPVQCMTHRNTLPFSSERPTLNPRNKK